MPIMFLMKRPYYDNLKRYMYIDDGRLLLNILGTLYVYRTPMYDWRDMLLKCILKKYHCEVKTVLEMLFIRVMTETKCMMFIMWLNTLYLFDRSLKINTIIKHLKLLSKELYVQRCHNIYFAIEGFSIMYILK